jgi:molecular chaperone Hsp33
MCGMSQTPAFLDTDRPPVPDIVVPRGVLPFYLPDRPVRGRLIRLGALADSILGRHSQPEASVRIVGECLALVAGLSTAPKFRGSFGLQIKGDGPLDLLVADCTEQGALRGYGRVDATRLANLATDQGALTAADLLGQGFFALTVDQGDQTERHQGIVKIEGTSIAAMAQHYFATSEQLACTVRLACAKTPAGWRASALILEKVAGHGGISPELSHDAQEESWATAKLLAATVTDAELLDDLLPAEDLLYRLFGSEGVAAGRARALSNGCRCSRAKLYNVLERFSTDDLDEMSIDGTIVMTCEFCNLDFRFPRDELGRAAQ